MLELLHIENIAVIEQADIAFLHGNVGGGCAQFHRLLLNILSLFATFLSLIEWSISQQGRNGNTF